MTGPAIEEALSPGSVFVLETLKREDDDLSLFSSNMIKMSKNKM